MYNDGDLKRNGFLGESVANGEVIVVKTHEWGAKVRYKFSAAILLVRDPVDSILSEYNRQGGGHTGHARQDMFAMEGGKRWKNFLKKKLIRWRGINSDWINNFHGPLLVISYSELRDNVEEQLNRMLQFLNVSVNKEEMDCALSRKEGIYKRPKMKKKPPIDDDLIYMVNTYRDDVLQLINQNEKFDNITLGK